MSFLLVFTAALVSCGSQKPQVITTKAEAQELSSQDRTTQNTNVVPTRSRRKETTSDEIESEINEEEIAESTESLTTIDAAIQYAMEYQGTRYRYGGSTNKGMDCSGLINVSFDKAGEQVPRTSMSLFQATQPIDIKEIQKGDLMFFATGRDRKKINHVALVTEVTPAEIRFIHATVSQGVTISSLNEPYWLGKYLSSGRLF
ncbi:C40 family peptidase [Nonlabens agnitus]|uniref:NlpC/P60 domain-containing protein n=1 Tax=Nonlabens agnitus TaxID=870484 RepID=A0A2S9WVB1_9FLAO|nr:C40 family peptidase [Nonlabens agnitus]PRP67306.1 hypothetical protein BST86_09455 [Nonlabens agnitus]